MAYENNLTRIGGLVERRTPIRMNLDAFAQAVNKMDINREKALREKSNILAAIGKVQLDSSEDQWKADFANDIINKIESANMFGDVSKSLDTAIDMAGYAANSPALLGRARNYELIKAKEDEVNKRALAGDIDEEVAKAWRIDMSDKKKSKDIIGNNGQVIGVEDWKPEWEPVKKVNSPDAIKKVFDSISPEQKSWGDTTTTYNKEENNSHTEGGKHGYKRSTLQNFLPVLKERLLNDGAWLTALEQERRVAKILLKQTEDELAEIDQNNPANSDKVNMLKYNQKRYKEDLGGDIYEGDIWDYFTKKYDKTIKSLPYNYRDDVTEKADHLLTTKGSGDGSFEPEKETATGNEAG